MVLKGHLPTKAGRLFAVIAVKGHLPTKPGRLFADMAVRGHFPTKSGEQKQIVWKNDKEGGKRKRT